MLTWILTCALWMRRRYAALRWTCVRVLTNSPTGLLLAPLLLLLLAIRIEPSEGALCIGNHWEFELAPCASFRWTECRKKRKMRVRRASNKRAHFSCAHLPAFSAQLVQRSVWRISTLVARMRTACQQEFAQVRSNSLGHSLARTFGQPWIHLALIDLA